MDSQEKSPKKFYKRWWFVSLVLIAFLVVVLNSIPSDSSSASQQSGPSEAHTLGQEAYLRLPGNDDPQQMICLGPTMDLYNQYTDALMAKDYEGIIDLQNQGLFCVHNGSQVKVIDTGVGYTKVRVEQGATSTDSDKIGEAGWSASEWVLAQ